MIKFLISCLVVAASLGFAEETIFVELETESPLLPLFLAPFYDQGSGFEAPYLEKLRKVLSFDLNFNGMTRVLEGTKGQRDEFKKIPFEALGEPAIVQKLGAYFVVKVRVKNKKLGAKLMTVNNLSTKEIDGLELTGDLSRDRRQIHKLADTIHKQLFGTEGIASTHILFTRKYKGGEKWLSEIYEVDWDGANMRAVTQGAGYAITPSYVPPQPGFSAGAFFYVSYQNGQPKIFYSSLKNFNPVRFSLLKGNQLMPALTRQRDKVAFISDVTGNPDLFLQPIHQDGSLNGKPSQIFATHKATQGTPTFSPDGNRIAFVSNKDGSPRIYMMSIPLAGTPLKNIKADLVSRVNKESTAPAWSPDGKKIAYTSMTDGTRQIWVYDLEKRKERQLTHGPGNKENPSWAPDSLHLTFNAIENRGSEVYILNLNQSEAIKITAGQGENRFPAWEPRA